MNSREKADVYNETHYFLGMTDDDVTHIIQMLDHHADERTETIVSRLRKELHLWLPKDRMDNIEDICNLSRSA